MLLSNSREEIQHKYHILNIWSVFLSFLWQKCEVFDTTCKSQVCPVGVLMSRQMSEEMESSLRSRQGCAGWQTFIPSRAPYDSGLYALTRESSRNLG